MSCLIKIVNTEKSVRCSENDIYCFDVTVGANKTMIKKEIENTFVGAKVVSVNTYRKKSVDYNFRNIRTKTKAYKRVFVKLKEGKIELSNI